MDGDANDLCTCCHGLFFLHISGTVYCSNEIFSVFSSTWALVLKYLVYFAAEFMDRCVLNVDLHKIIEGQGQV